MSRYGVQKGFTYQVAPALVAEQPGLTAREIARIALDRGLCSSVAEEPERSLAESLSKAVREGLHPEVIVGGSRPCRYYPRLYYLKTPDIDEPEKADLSCAIADELRASAQLKAWAAEHLSEPLARAAETVIAALRAGGKVLLCGNGGSAADCQHLAGELVGRYRRERGALAAIALTTDTSILTALGNDLGFEAVFARQVEALALPGDVLIAISTSGQSPNVLAAVAAAKARGCTTIAFAGRDGGPLAKAVDMALVVAAEETPRIQECHIALGHALCRAVEDALFGPPTTPEGGAVPPAG